MPSLRQRLQTALRKVLPKDPDSAINGTVLYERVKPLIPADYAEASVRHHFSVMASDASTPIAKVERGHGYYMRSTAAESTGGRGAAKRKPDATPDHQPEEVTRELEAAQHALRVSEQFRALFMRHALSRKRFPMSLERATHDENGDLRPLGIVPWDAPDVIFAECVSEEPAEVSTAPSTKDPMRNRRLMEQSFRFCAVNLATAVTASTYRELFFRCVSNSRWAHSAQLVIASAVQDKAIAADLHHLGNAYGVAVISYGMTATQLEKLPTARVIADLSESKLDDLVGTLDVTAISMGQDRDTLHG